MCWKGFIKKIDLCFLLVFQPLEEALKSALKSDFEDVVLGLLMSPAQYDAHALKQALKVTLRVNNIKLKRAICTGKDDHCCHGHLLNLFTPTCSTGFRYL